AAEVLTRRAADPENETLADFARRHLGRTATRVLIDAMQAGIFAGNPGRLSLSAPLPRMAGLEGAHRNPHPPPMRLRRERSGAGAPTETAGPSGTLSSFTGGLSMLTRTLAEKLGAVIRLNTEVRSISRVAGGWRLQMASGGNDAESERLVLAVPSFAAARLLRPIDADLASELESIEYAPIAVVHLGYAQTESAGAGGVWVFVTPEGGPPGPR